MYTVKIVFTNDKNIRFKYDTITELFSFLENVEKGILDSLILSLITEDYGYKINCRDIAYVYYEKINESVKDNSV